MEHGIPSLTTQEPTLNARPTPGDPMQLVSLWPVFCTFSTGLSPTPDSGLQRAAQQVQYLTRSQGPVCFCGIMGRCPLSSCPVGSSLQPGVAHPGQRPVECSTLYGDEGNAGSCSRPEKLGLPTGSRALRQPLHSGLSCEAPGGGPGLCSWSLPSLEEPGAIMGSVSLARP